jgi:hypothetical protein
LKGKPLPQNPKQAPWQNEQMNTNYADKNGLERASTARSSLGRIRFLLCLQQNLNSRVGFLAERHRLRGAKEIASNAKIAKSGN